MFENNTNPLISVIVPIYNVEKYIRECVDSIINQNYRNIEVLLIDDGSPDNSAVIIDEYSKKDKRVKVLHKQNGGLSDARNYGIENAIGEYLMFIDGDDFLLGTDCIEKIVNSINKTRADIIQYKKVYWYNTNNIKYDNDLQCLNSVNIIDTLSRLNKNGAISVSACDKVIKRSLINENSIRFKKGLLCEDILFSYQLYLIVKDIELLNENIYAYRQLREGSISTSKTKKSFDSLYEIIKFWLNFSYPNTKYKDLYFNLISYWYLILRTDYPVEYYSKESTMFFKKYDEVMIKYNKNHKIQMAYVIYRIFGYENMLKIIKCYLYFKKYGIVRIK